MSINRKEIMPGVFLNCLNSSKFKTSFISITFLNQLTRDNASMNALIPFVLRRGTMSYPDMKSLNERMDELYGTVIEPNIRLAGEIQGTGFIASFPEEKYLPHGETVTEDVIGLLSEMILRPYTRGGLFFPTYVDSEKENLIDLINSLINQKRSYAVTKCVKEMCCYEDISIGKFGCVQDVENINYKKLTKYYHRFLQESPIEIFFCGQTDMSVIENLFKEALCTLPRGNIDFDMGTDIRMNAVEDEVRYFEENMDVTQGKLSIGFRLGECMNSLNVSALQMFNAVYGGSVTSKLFNNVREKMQLCYYAASTINVHKGIMVAYSGIEFDKFDQAKDEILHQLDEIRCGNITDDELEFAKAGLVSDYNSVSDSQYDLETFYFNNNILGYECTPEEIAQDAMNVTKQDVIDIANSVVCDLIYFLRDSNYDDKE